jgi:hypothetical protein
MRAASSIMTMNGGSAVACGTTRSVVVPLRHAQLKQRELLSITPRCSTVASPVSTPIDEAFCNTEYVTERPLRRDVRRR